MNSVLKYSFLFLLSCFLLDRSLGLLLDNIYKRNKIGEAGGKINYFIENIEKPDFLVLGSSRGLSHIIPDSFGQKTFNLSHHGMKIPFNAGLIHILNKKNKLPKILVLHIELSSFSFYEGYDIDKSETAFLRYYYHSVPEIKEYIDEISFFEGIKYYSRLYRYNGTIPSLISNYFLTLNAPPTDNGFEISFSSPRDSIKVLKQVELQSKRKAPNKPLVISETSINYLTDAISICKKTGTNLVIVTSPKYQPKNQGEIKASIFLLDFLKKNNIPFLDYNDNRIKELRKLKYWRDFEHMHIQGAKIFTNQLKNDIQNIIPLTNYQE